MRSTVGKAARWEVVLARLATHGDVDVLELADEIGCSGSTVRRDLRELEAKRLLSRVYGGAVTTGALYELPLDRRSGQRRQEKRLIAVEAVRRIEPGMVIGITGGTTCAAMIHELMGRNIADVTVVTNSLAIAQDVARHKEYRLVVTGGFVRPASMELVGPLPELMIPTINLNLAFLGVDGISPEAGLTIHSDLEARTNELLMRRAARHIVLADHVKVGQAVFARICACRDVHELITDDGADRDVLAELRVEGITVTVAGSNTSVTAGN